VTGQAKYTPEPAFIQGTNGGFHHFPFWLDDWGHVPKAADILAYNGVQIDQGPTRHGVTRGNTIYFFDPLGIRNEVFTGGYSPDPDFPAITWSEDQFGRGLPLAECLSELGSELESELSSDPNCFPVCSPTVGSWRHTPRASASPLHVTTRSPSPWTSSVGRPSGRRDAGEASA